MIDWILEKFTDIDTRESAHGFSNELLDQGVFLHMNRRLRFLDGHYFYCLRTINPNSTISFDEEKLHSPDGEGKGCGGSPVTVSDIESEGEDADSAPTDEPLVDNSSTPKLGAASSVQWFLSKFGRPSLSLSNAELPASSSPINKPPRALRREKIALVKSIGVDMDPQKRSGMCRLDF
jgi:hypothetical protein